MFIAHLPAGYLAAATAQRFGLCFSAFRMNETQLLLSPGVWLALALILAVSTALLGYLLARAKIEQAALRGQLEQSDNVLRAKEESHQQELVARANQELANKQLALASLREEAEGEKTALKIEIERLRAALRSEESMLEQFTHISDKALKSQGANLSEQQKQSLEPLLAPLRDKLKELGDSVKDERDQRTAGKAQLETLVKELMERAGNISKDARNLTLALKGESKTQGNWGEMILEKMLENVGLKKGEEYETQEYAQSEEGKRLYADVVVKLPGKRCIIIDSKVSLTAYARAVESEDESARAAALNEHVASVQAHVRELAAKNYPRAIEGSLSYVLMFIPNEASYVAAVQHAPHLQEDAYRNGILIVSPTNLLMALQIAHHLWAREKQTQNVKEIIDKATKIYDKLYNFSKSFDDVGDKLHKAVESFDKSHGQLRKGPGNAFRQLEELRRMGLAPKKNLEYEGDGEDAELLPAAEEGVQGE